MTRHPVLCAIADDSTEATDVALAFRAAGLRVALLFGVPDRALPAPDTQVAVVALKTRTTPAADAVQQTLAAVRWAESIGAHRFYFKYCSTFDSTAAGNIGQVADALAERLKAGITVVTPASPVHGRTVLGGELFVAGVPLADTAMRHHPLTPMTDSNLLRLLRAQTSAPVAHVPLSTVRQGPRAVGDALAMLEADGARYAIVDATADDDLLAIGAAVIDSALVTGAAGLAAGLAAALAESAAHCSADLGVEDSRSGGRAGAGGSVPDLGSFQRAAVLAGSCSARTLQQIERLSQRAPTHFLDVLAHPNARELAGAALSWHDQLPSSEGRPASVPLIYSSQPPDALAKTQRCVGAQRAAEIVEQATGLIARGLIDRGVDRLIVAGGETSGAVLASLGVTAGVVGPEAAPGVPWIFVPGPAPLALLLKSGNFGDPDLLVTASGAAWRPGAQPAAAPHRTGVRPPEEN